MILVGRAKEKSLELSIVLENAQLDFELSSVGPHIQNIDCWHRRSKSPPSEVSAGKLTFKPSLAVATQVKSRGKLEMGTVQRVANLIETTSLERVSSRLKVRMDG